MRKRTAFMLWLSLAAAACSGSATPTQPTSSSTVAAISGGSLSGASRYPANCSVGELRDCSAVSIRGISKPGPY
jgi:hypothetical protein